MKQFYRLAALFLALLLLCGCAAGNGYGKPERKEGQDQYLTDPVRRASRSRSSRRT